MKIDPADYVDVGLLTYREIRLIADALALDSVLAEDNEDYEKLDELNELGIYFTSLTEEDSHRDDQRLPRGGDRVDGRKRRTEQESPAHSDSDHAPAKRSRRVLSGRTQSTPEQGRRVHADGRDEGVSGLGKTRGRKTRNRKDRRATGR